jgi:thiamine-phosphate pyrophosphorylase
MQVEFTPAVVRALEVARRWAGVLSDVEVRPAHLLLGLLQEEEGRPALLLTDAGLDRARVYSLLAPERSTEPADVVEGNVPEGPRVEAILRDGLRLAREVFAEPTVTSERLLLALLRGDDGLRQALEGLGMIFSSLQAEILSGQEPPLQLDEPLNLREPTEEIDTARILDASANRAREALRVLEDYCRFVLDDRLLCAELKQLRHDLAEALRDLPVHLLLQGRETLRDVGTTLSTPQEQQRSSLSAVVQASGKRLQEALRSLEEYGKLRSPTLGQSLEALRYRSYTLERALVLGAGARQQLADARLYVLLSAGACTLGLGRTIREAAEGGAQVFQLREKNLSARDLLARAREVRRLTREAGALFILNDRPDIARLSDADGVHVGQEELPVMEARRILGPDALVGVSTHNLEQVRQAVFDGASYIGVGPTFASTTKSFADYPGLDFVREATAATSLPAFVIGGVSMQNLEAAMAAGARRVAVGHAICESETPGAIAGAMHRMLAD